MNLLLNANARQIPLADQSVHCVVTIPPTVFDPFVGSGTTCMVARKHGRHAIGLDLSWDYLNTNARERLVYGGFVPVADGINQLTINI